MNIPENTPEAHLPFQIASHLESKSIQPYELTTPVELMADNRTPLAELQIRHHREAKEIESLAGVAACADARLNWSKFLGTAQVVTYPSIASAAPKDRLAFAVAHRSVAELFVLQHHDGSQGFPLKGCGGLAVKAERVRNGDSGEKKGVVGYVDQDIASPEVYVQAIQTAVAFAKHTDKPVLAGSVDHTTGLIYPFAIIAHRGHAIAASVAVDEWLDPDAIYRSGQLPVLADSQIPENFLRILKMNRYAVKQIQERQPQFSESQKVQDPPAVVISTSIVPAAVRYPYTFGEPNTHFGIRLPFIKDAGTIKLAPEDITKAIAQAEYPISHGTHARDGQNFYHTSKIIIETQNIDLSRYIADQLASQPWIKEWLDRRESNQIWVGKIKSGRTQQMEVYKSS